MGNRVSISFRSGKQESVALFSHWGGMEFVKQAREYVKDLRKCIAKDKFATGWPLGRLEPNTVMVDFVMHATILWLVESQRIGERGLNTKHITNDLYLAATENDGDNDGNGHHVINLGHPIKLKRRKPYNGHYVTLRKPCRRTKKRTRTA
jgi:hypothetical protein